MISKYISKKTNSIKLNAKNIVNKKNVISYSLSDIDSKGVINSSQLDLSKITGSSADAAQGINYIGESNLYKDIWGGDKDFEYEINDDGSILIKNDGVGIGYTNAEGFQSILANYDLSENDEFIPVEPSYEETPEVSNYAPSQVLNEENQRYVDKLSSQTTNPNFSKKDMGRIFNPYSSDINKEAVGHGGKPYEELGDGSYKRYYTTGYVMEFYNAKTNVMTTYNNDGTIASRVSYDGNPEDGKVLNTVEYSYDEDGNISKISGLNGPVKEIEYFYGEDGTAYRGEKLTDGRYSLTSYNSSGKKVSSIVGYYTGTIYSENSSLNIPMVYGDQEVYENGVLKEKYYNNGDYALYDESGIKEKHLASGVVYNYSDNRVSSVMFENNEGNSEALSILEDERISQYVDYNAIKDISIQDNKKILYFTDGREIDIFDNAIYGKDASNNIIFGYNINGDNLSTVSIFDINNIYSEQYGGRQSNFRNYTDTILSDPLIMEELEKTFPGSSYQEKYNYLCSMASVCCGYVDCSNSVFKNYEGREQDFYNTFGFSMYTVDENGNKNFNWELMTLKFFNYTWIKETNWSLYDYYSNTSVKGFYANNTTSFENFMRDEFGVNITDVHYTFDDIGTMSNSSGFYGDGEYMETNFTNFDEAIEAYNRIMETNPDSITINATGYELINKNNSYDVFTSKNSSHAMTLIGVEDGKFVVSSFGKEYYINPYNTDSVDFNVINYE